MCGIAGILSKTPDHAIAERMIRALAHRGPDGEGIMDLPMAVFAHRRLSIIDLSDAGRQPMESYDGRFVITFNGEIYNYKELRAELAGYPFRSQTDTEVILAAWETWGEACLDRFLGMFAFAIADRKEQTVTIVRDRLGIKPLYYAEQNGSLLFASEIKALFAGGVKAKPNERMLAHYLLYGYYDHTPETFYEGVRSLRGGHLMRWKEGKSEIKRWWYLPDHVAPITHLKEEEVIATFRGLLDDSLRMHLRSDVPVGINLSSGIDSLSLFFELQRIAELSKLHIFSMGFADPAFDETTDIAGLAEQAGVPFHRVEITPADEERYRDAVSTALDQPYGGLSTIGYYKLMTEPRKHGVKVLLEGQGVDEMLGGYRYFTGPLYRDYVREGRWDRIGAEVRRGAQDRAPWHLWQSAMGFVETWHKAGRTAFQDGTAFLHHECLRPEWVARAQQVETPVFEAPFASAFQNALYRDTTATKLPRVLRFNDLVSMAFGLELRVPFLDHRIVEYAFSLPDVWKMADGRTKVLLRESMKGVVPEALRTRQKRPQSSPQTLWYKTALQENVAKVLRSDALRALPMVDAVAAQKSFDAFVHDPKQNNSFFYWQLINLLQVYRVCGL
ncbi:MAG: asparagine synthase (glutamine-hydrolyzing) [Patescibacteria group bacterium]